jgi:hypothetical protein
MAVHEVIMRFKADIPDDEWAEMLKEIKADPPLGPETADVSEATITVDGVEMFSYHRVQEKPELV